MEKKFERYERQKQVRMLERFVKKTTNMLKHPDVSKESFASRVEKLLIELHKLPEVDLQSNAHKELKNVVDYIVSQSTSKHKMEEIRDNIYYQLNQREKNRNNARYKKDKYKNFNDGWE